MKVSFCVRASHQVEAARALAEGIRRHGDEAVISPGPAADADVLACWGWRKGRTLMETGRNVLVLERAYVGDRFVWTSLGWNGLNGRAVFPIVDGGQRWRRYFRDVMKPWRDPGEQKRALIIGQVPTDAACAHLNFGEWATKAWRALRAAGWNVRFRPHPKATWLRVGAPLAAGAVKFRDDTGLEDDFDAADLVVTYNSNAGVLSVLRGVPTVSCDPGSMAWPVTSHAVTDPPQTPDRQAWAHRIACCQWLPIEMANGEAWAAVKAVMPAAREAAA